MKILLITSIFLISSCAVSWKKDSPKIKASGDQVLSAKELAEKAAKE